MSQGRRFSRGAQLVVSAISGEMSARIFVLTDALVPGAYLGSHRLETTDRRRVDIADCSS